MLTGLQKQESQRAKQQSVQHVIIDIYVFVHDYTTKTKLRDYIDSKLLTLHRSVVQLVCIF